MKALSISLVMIGLVLNPVLLSAEPTKKRKELPAARSKTGSVWKGIQKNSEDALRRRAALGQTSGVLRGS